MHRLAGLNQEQRKLLADLLNTMSKLLIGGGLIGPWLQQINITLVSALSAVFTGVALHGVALYMLSEQEGSDGDA